MRSRNSTRPMLTGLQTTGAENLTRRAAIETEKDITGADARTARTTLAGAVTRRAENADRAVVRTKREPTGLGMKMRVGAVAGLIGIAMKRVDLLADTVMTKNHDLVDHAVKARPGSGAHEVLKSPSPVAIAGRRSHDRVAPVPPLRSLPRVLCPVKRSRESVQGDHRTVPTLTAVTDPIAPGQAPRARLPELPDETVDSLPKVVLAALAADAARLMNRRPTTSERRSGQSGAQRRRNLSGSVSLHASEKPPGRPRRLGRSRARNQRSSRSGDIVARGDTATQGDLGLMTSGTAPQQQSERSRLRLHLRLRGGSSASRLQITRRLHARSLLWRNQSENERRSLLPLKKRPSGRGPSTDVLGSRWMKHALGRVVHAMSQHLNLPETEMPVHPGTSGWTRRTRDAKLDMRSGARRKPRRRRRRSQEASRVHSRSCLAANERGARLAALYFFS